MTTYVISALFLFLAFYSFLGWIAEVVYVLLREKHLQNRGFLTGPLVPIYGFGAIALILFVAPYISNPFLVFLASVIITSALEFLTHLVLDKLFHIELWEYRSRRFNLQGRICLENSLLFGMLGLLLVYAIHPAFSQLIVRLPPEILIAVAWTMIGILIIDSANSIRSLAKLRPILDEVAGTLAQTQDRIQQNAVALQNGIDHRRESAIYLATVERLTRAFPQAASSRRVTPQEET
jgi:uncharacterized membrane protein